MNSRLCVSNLGEDVTNDALRHLFSHYGKVTHAEVMLESHTGRSRGFGLIQFADESEAKAAMAALDGSMLAGHAISVREPRFGPDPGEFGDRSGMERCDYRH